MVFDDATLYWPKYSESPSNTEHTVELKLKIIKSALMVKCLKVQKTQTFLSSWTSKKGIAQNLWRH